tara:strand:- start:5755 stop:6780 length:1026 start_codon:yes stop_codon:yes gene_type:complete
MSVRSDKADINLTGPGAVAADALATINAAQQSDSPLSEANEYNVSSPTNPLTRSIVVGVRASLDDLCLRKATSVWAPSTEALKSMFQQKRFTDLAGSSQASGDLKSIVLHAISVSNVKSTFPITLGTHITGVDNKTFSITGESFSHIVLPEHASTMSTKLQEDDVTMAYEFGRKFPGYTSENLMEKGIHEVNARKFCLVAADHPLVAAISENAEKLQMGEISMMPEGLVKISSQLYETIMPMVKAQVESQIKVRDLTSANVSIAPAEFSSWQDARTALMSEGKAGLKSRLEAELAAADSEAVIDKLRSRFNEEERALEHKIDHTVHTFNATLDVVYNFLSP